MHAMPSPLLAFGEDTFESCRKPQGKQGERAFMLGASTPLLSARYRQDTFNIHIAGMIDDEKDVQWRVVAQKIKICMERVNDQLLLQAQ